MCVIKLISSPIQTDLVFAALRMYAICQCKLWVFFVTLLLGGINPIIVVASLVHKRVPHEERNNVEILRLGFVFL